MTIANAAQRGLTLCALTLVVLIGLGTFAGGLSAASGRAAIATPSAADSGSTITVSGHGGVLVPPDTASITIGVDVTRPVMSDAQADATAQATAITDVLKAEGVAAADIQTSNYVVNIIRSYDENGNPTETQGYQVSNQVDVVLRDVARVGEVLAAAVAAGANNIWGINFYVDDPSTAASEARKAAMANARTKADELAAIEGLALGRVVSINESFVPVGPPAVFYGAVGAEAKDSAVPVTIGSVEVAVDVTVTYATP